MMSCFTNQAVNHVMMKSTRYLHGWACISLCAGFLATQIHYTATLKSLIIIR